MMKNLLKSSIGTLSLFSVFCGFLSFAFTPQFNCLGLTRLSLIPIGFWKNNYLNTKLVLRSVLFFHSLPQSCPIQENQHIHYWFASRAWFALVSLSPLQPSIHKALHHEIFSKSLIWLLQALLTPRLNRSIFTRISIDPAYLSSYRSNTTSSRSSPPAKDTIRYPTTTTAGRTDAMGLAMPPMSTNLST